MTTRAVAFLGISLCLSAGALLAAEFPEAEIANRAIRAKLYLPDAERGYYRGTRFDWSGVIHSLQCAGHEYFGPWFESHDPKGDDGITGPVEEFRTNDAGLGYDEAKGGGAFIRIGVGVVRKPAGESKYRQFGTYDIVDPGKWAVRQKPGRIEFIHEVSDENGYAYIYRKTVRLVGNKPELVLEHSLKNTGRRPIETSGYDHNFFVMDGQPAGPDFRVRFRFEPRATRDLRGLAEIQGRALVYTSELQKGQTVFTELEGFGTSARDYDIRIENRKTGAGVRIRGNQPLEKVVYWSIRPTLCPEPWIKMRVEPGRERKWKIDYRFYTLSAPAK